MSITSEGGILRQSRDGGMVRVGAVFVRARVRGRTVSGMGGTEILVYGKTGPYDRWVTQNNPDRLPFIQPRENVPTHSDDGSHYLKWKLCLSAVARDVDGNEEPYWHEHYLMVSDEEGALESAHWLLDKHPALLNFQ